MLYIILILAILYLYYKNKDKSTKLSVYEFANKIKQNNFDYLLDVRTPEEWNLGHHEKAILVPIGSFVTELPKIITNKNSKILLYCKKGIRAEASAKIAERLNYNNIFWLDGTWDELKQIV